MPTLLLFLMGASGAAFAQATGPAATGRPPAEDLEGRPQGVGVGVALGEPAGLALSFRPDADQAVHVVTGWSFVDQRLHAAVDWTRTAHAWTAESTPNLRYPLYIGLGASVRAGGGSPGGSPGRGRANTDPDATGLGLRVPVGLLLQPQELRLDLALELAPRIGVLPSFGLGFEGAVVARYYLGPRAQPPADPTRRR
jgi:hypothetical protein